MNNANGNGGSPKPKKAPGKTGKVLNDLFNPQLGQSIRPIGENLNMFVQMIAMIFAANRLFPRNHPALLGNPNVRLSLSEVIRTAYSQLQFTREGLPQVVLFFATVGTLVFTGLLLVTLLLSAFVGTAHAQTNIFTYPDPAQDWSKGVLNYLFNPAGGTNGLTAFNSTAVQGALIKALSFYSTAILVCAGFILLYHLVSMIVETAHTGKPMGRANQIWAPIRLIVAIGLLVPIASGLNSGQFIVIKMAEWGSGLASQTWKVFVDGLKAQQFAVTRIEAPSIAEAVKSGLRVRICQHAYNTQLYTLMRAALPAGQATATRWEIDEKAVPARATNPFGGSTVWFTNNALSTFPVCGGTLFPNTSVAPGATGEARSLASAAASINQAHITAYDSVKGAMDTLAVKICSVQMGFSCTKTCALNPTQSGCTVNPSTLNPDEFSAIAAQYQSALDTAITSAQSISANMTTALDNSVKLGWMSAGILFSDIARRQGMVFEATMSGVPTFTGATILAGGGAYNYNLLQRREGVDVRSFEDSARVAMQRSEAWLDNAVTAYRNSPAANAVNRISIDANDLQGDNRAASMGVIERNIVNPILNVLNSVLSVTGIWTSGGNLGFNLNQTANPLAELVTFGQKKLNAGILTMGIGFLLVGGAGLVGGAASIGGALGIVGGPLAAILNFGAGLITAVAGLFAVIATILCLAGIILCFVVPLLPFIKFLFNIISWVVSVVGSIISIPLFALAHLNPYGDGYTGNAKNGYSFLFSLLLRPTLMVFGLVCGLLIFMIGVSLINVGFESAVLRSTGYGGTYDFITKLIFSVMYVILIYICANKCFVGIDYFPTLGMSWLGAQGLDHQRMGDQAPMSSLSSVAAGYLFQQGSSAIINSGKGVGDAGKKLLEGQAQHILKDQGKNLRTTGGSESRPKDPTSFMDRLMNGDRIKQLQAGWDANDEAIYKENLLNATRGGEGQQDNPTQPTDNTNNATQPTDNRTPFQQRRDRGEGSPPRDRPRGGRGR